MLISLQLLRIRKAFQAHVPLVDGADLSGQVALYFIVPLLFTIRIPAESTDNVFEISMLSLPIFLMFTRMTPTSTGIGSAISLLSPDI